MMTAETARKQIYQIIERLPEEKLPNILRFLQQLLKEADTVSIAETPPIYQIHRDAVSTGVPDLADQHDHYLYGLDKRDA